MSFFILTLFCCFDDMIKPKIMKFYLVIIIEECRAVTMDEN